MTIAAAAAAAKMGADWEPHVWENLGWHWSVRSLDGRWKLHPGGAGGFTAFLGLDASGGKWAGHGDSPREAIDAVLALAHDDLLEITKLIVNVPRMSIA